MTIYGIPILRRFRPARNPRPEDVVLERAREEARRMHQTFAVRESLPPNVPRAWCEDCEAVVVLVGDACPCGSRSTAIVSRSWTAPKAVAA